MNKVLNKIRFYIMGFMCIVCLFSYLFIYQPMYSELKYSKQQSFIYSAEAVEYAADIYIKGSMDDAQSLSSRTMIKQKIIEYRNGNAALQELEEFTKARYSDGYKVLNNITGAFRIVDNNVIAQQGKVDLAKAAGIKKISEVTPVIDTDSLVVTIYSPIKDGGEILGYDIAFFEMSEMLNGAVHEGHMLHEMYSVGDVQKLLSKNNSMQISEGEYLVTGKSTTWYIKQLENMNAYFAASTSNVILYKALNTISASILFALPVIILVLILIINTLTFRSFGKIVKSLEEAKDTYKEFALTDSLTKTFSRGYFNNYIEKHVLEKLSGQSLAVVMIDINDFKYINDTYGHLIGDEVLKEIARILKSSVRAEDKVVRYGGDEFLLLLEDCNIEKGQEILLRIVNSIRNIDKFDFSIEISYGIAEIRNKEEFLAGIQKADAEMYEMKGNKLTE